MEDEAFDALAQIERDRDLTGGLRHRWLAALLTISWITRTETGVMLTLAGREALDQFNAARSGRA